jgi:hypothetical protein
MTRRAVELEQYRERVNELQGTSPAATGSGLVDPNLDPNSVLDPSRGTASHAGGPALPRDLQGFM